MYEPPGYRRSSYAEPASTTLPLVLAILTTLFCCQPVGIVAIVFAAIAMTKNGSGEYEDAQKFARWARTTSLIAVVVGLAGIAAYFFVFGGAAAMQGAGP